MTALFRCLPWRRKRRAARAAVSLRFPNLSIRSYGMSTITTTLQDDGKIAFTVDPNGFKDQLGNAVPAPADLAWSTTDNTIVSVAADSGNLTGFFVSGNDGTATVSLTGAGSTLWSDAFTIAKAAAVTASVTLGAVVAK